MNRELSLMGQRLNTMINAVLYESALLIHAYGVRWPSTCAVQRIRFRFRKVKHCHYYNLHVKK